MVGVKLMDTLKRLYTRWRQPIDPLGLSPLRLVLGVLLLAGAAVIVVSQVLGVVNAPPITIETTDDEASIYFYADRSVVAFPGDCVTVRWSVEGIQEVYLNQYGLVGEGERQWCETTDRSIKPTLRVLFKDGTWRAYPANVKTLWIELNTPLLGAWTVGLLIAGAYALKTPLLAPLIDRLRTNARFQEAALLLWMFGVISIYWFMDGYGFSTLMTWLQKLNNFLQSFFSAPYQG